MNVAQFPNITPLNVALVGASGPLMLQNRNTGPWGFTVVEGARGKGNLTDMGIVEGLSVDDILAMFDQESIDLLKLDIEGAELEVLNNSSGWMPRTTLLVAELHDGIKPGCVDAFENSNAGRTKFRMGKEKFASLLENSANLTNLCPELANANSVSAFVLERIVRKEPCSLVRLSHCEAKFLSHPIGVTRKDINRSLKRQFGYVDISDDEVIAISAMIKAAALSCDVAGVPHFRALDQVRLNEGDESLKLWSLVAPAARRLKAFNSGTVFTSVNIHLRLMERDFLREIVEATQSVTLVGCRDLRSNFHALGFNEVFYIPVPEAARTRGDEQVARHYPEAFNEIVTRIRSEQRRGLFFVGAGFLGKIYCHEIRLAGGVAIDMGSVMDLWAGVPSRTGHENIIDKFMLKDQ